MNKAVVAGWVGLLAWSMGLLSTDAWAQGGWPSGPSGSTPVKPQCGDPPPEIADPSPGDSTPCWEYVSSSGWNQLFKCITVTNCPTAEGQGGQTGDCACLNVEGESKAIMLPGPYWDVTPGSVVTGPDNPDCGDPDIKPIDPEEIPWWEAKSDDDSIAIASPEMGVGENADFTVFAATEPGKCKVNVKWNLGLEMDGITTCQTNFILTGPSVAVTVYEVTSDYPNTGDCPALVPVEYNPSAVGLTPKPDLNNNKLKPFQVCDNGQDCDRWRIKGGAYLVLKQGWYRTHNQVKSTECPQPLWAIIPRSIDAVGRTVKHEMMHCEKAREDIKDINNTIVGPALMETFSSKGACETRIESLKAEIITEWDERWDKNKHHYYHVGYEKYKIDNCGNETPDGKYVGGEE